MKAAGEVSYCYVTTKLQKKEKYETKCEQSKVITNMSEKIDKIVYLSELVEQKHDSFFEVGTYFYSYNQDCMWFAMLFEWGMH